MAIKGKISSWQHCAYYLRWLHHFTVAKTILNDLISFKGVEPHHEVLMGFTFTTAMLLALFHLYAAHPAITWRSYRDRACCNSPNHNNTPKYTPGHFGVSLRCSKYYSVRLHTTHQNNTGFPGAICDGNYDFVAKIYPRYIVRQAKTHCPLQEFEKLIFSLKYSRRTNYLILRLSLSNAHI